MPFDALQTAHVRLHGDEKLAPLGEPARVWAIGSLYGRYGALTQLHEELAGKIRPKDRIVYLGNYLGSHTLWTGEGLALLDELIAFRNAVIAIPGFFASDVVFLKGGHEDLLIQLLRLPFQRQPAQWLVDALDNGLESYLASYGMFESLIANIDKGLIALNHWANHMRKAMRAHAGHETLLENLNSAALTAYSHFSGQIMLVPSSLDPRLPLHLQYENLVCPSADADIASLRAYAGCSRLVRGGGSKHMVFNEKTFVLDLDGGDSLNGKLHAVCLDPQGHLIDHLSY